MSQIQLSPEKSSSDTNLLENKNLTPPQYVFERQNKRRRGAEDDTTYLSATLEVFKNEIRQMFQDLIAEHSNKFSKLEESLSNIQKTNQDIENSIEFIATQYEEMRIKIETLDQKCKDNAKYINHLEDKIEDLQRNSRSTTLEIRHLPASQSETKENLLSRLTYLANRLNVSISESDVKDIFRIPGKADSHKPVIVELSTTMIKLKLLKAIKSFNQENKIHKLDASHFGLHGNSTSVYVVEHLTPKANRLYFLARDLVKTGLFKFCWTSNGKIFVRKAEEAPVVLVKSEEQITALKNSN